MKYDNKPIERHKEKIIIASSSTEIYTHVNTREFGRIKAPLIY